MTTSPFTVRERTVLDALLATICPPICDLRVASNALLLALARLAPHRLKKLRPLLVMLAGPLLQFVLIGRWSSFPDLDAAERERVLCAMADSPFGALRTAFQVFKRLCAFVAYAAVDENGANPTWPAIGYPGPRSDRAPQAIAPQAATSQATAMRAPTPQATAMKAPTPQAAEPQAAGSPAAQEDAPKESAPEKSGPLRTSDLDAESLDCDVVVVGSGAGGGVAAALFAQAGRRVIVIEAGPPTDPSSFTQLEADAFGAYYLDSALSATNDLAVSVLAGACVGGGTTVNWCTSLRLPEKIAGQWSKASGGVDFASGLAPHYDAVSARLDVQTTSDHNPNNAALLRGCRALGWHNAEIPRNATHCADGCGYCGFGCSYRNKRSTAETYLRDAVEAGAKIIPNARVDRVIIEQGRAMGVEVIHAGDRRSTLRASTVVASAGSLRTPGILRRSGISSGHLGRHLQLHPTTALFAEYDEPIETWRGPMQTVVCDQFGDIDDGYGAKLEAVPAHPGLSALALPWRSQQQHYELMSRARFAAALIVLTRDRAEGSVSVDERADIQYELGVYDAGHMLTALAGLVELSFASGARSVVTLHTSPMQLAREEASKAKLADFANELRARGAAPNRLGVFSAHQMGTCRMHPDVRFGVVDEYGAVHGVKGLIVADASVFPLSSGVNPMLTIMALAHRAISHRVKPASSLTARSSNGRDR